MKPISSYSGRFSAAAAALVMAGLVAALSAPSAARAQESLKPPEQQLSVLLELASTYQSSYLQVVAVSCFQLYSSTGIIATDFSHGYLAATTALDALEKNTLLLSVCLTTLTDLREITPADDTPALAEIDRLLGILNAENELVNALTEVCLNPSDTNSALVETTRGRVEAALDSYTASWAEE